MKTITQKLALLLTMALALGANAQVKTSIKQGDWTDPTVWSPAGVPTAADTMVIIDSRVAVSNNPSLSGCGCEHLVVKKGAYLNITQGGVTLTGKKTLTLEADADLTASGGLFEWSGDVVNNDGFIVARYVDIDTKLLINTPGDPYRSTLHSTNELNITADTILNYSKMSGHQGGVSTISTNWLYNEGSVGMQHGAFLINGGINNGTVGGDLASFEISNGGEFINKGRVSPTDLRIVKGTFVNDSRIKITGNFDIGGPITPVTPVKFVNNIPAKVFVGGSLTYIGSQANQDSLVNHYTIEVKNWFNHGPVYGLGGKFCITDSSENTSTVTARSICDNTPQSAGLFDVNTGTVAPTVVACTNGCSDTTMNVLHNGLAKDTLHVCPGDIVYLNVPEGFFGHDWFLDGYETYAFGDTVAVTIDSSFHDGRFISAENVQHYVSETSVHSDTVYFVVHDSCVVPSSEVWPGDANSDGVANLYDVLNLGIAFGETGTARATSSILWTGHTATDWGKTFLTGVDIKHADCDGDGTVYVNLIATVDNQDDFDAIVINYGKTHNKNAEANNAGPNDPTLRILFEDDSAAVSTVTKASVLLGEQGKQATAYGIAFTINYNASLVDSGSITVDFANSWINPNPANPLNLVMDFHNDGQVDIAISRTDHQAIVGYGEIATMYITMEDNVNGKNAASKNLPMWITGARLIDEVGVILPVNVAPDTIVVFETINSIAPLTRRVAKVYPNPATNIINIVDEEEVQAINITDMLGRVVYTRAVTGANNVVTIDVAELPVGVYQLSLTTANGIANAKFVKK